MTVENDKTMIKVDIADSSPNKYNIVWKGEAVLADIKEIITVMNNIDPSLKKNVKKF